MSFITHVFAPLLPSATETNARPSAQAPPSPGVGGHRVSAHVPLSERSHSIGLEMNRVGYRTYLDLVSRPTTIHIVDAQNTRTVTALSSVETPATTSLWHLLTSNDTRGRHPSPRFAARATPTKPIGRAPGYPSNVPSEPSELPPGSDSQTCDGSNTPGLFPQPVECCTACGQAVNSQGTQHPGTGADAGTNNSPQPPAHHRDPTAPEEEEDPYNTNRRLFPDQVCHHDVPYHIIGTVGEGDVCRVFLALKNGLESVWLKVTPKLNCYRTAGAKRALMLDRDCMIKAAELPLQFWTPLRGAWEDKHNYYLCMDAYMGSLEHRISAAAGGYVLTQREVRLMCAEMLLALRDLRDHEIVYGVIRPDRFLIMHTGKVVLHDFGMAQRPSESDKRQDGYKFVSWNAPMIVSPGPGYAAPQTIPDDGVCTHMTDLYSLALVFLQLMAGLEDPIWSTDVVPPHFPGDEMEWQEIPSLHRQQWLHDNKPWARIDPAILPLDSPGMKLCLEMMSDTPPEIEVLMRHPYFEDLDFDQVYAGAIEHDDQINSPRFLIDETSRDLTFQGRYALKKPDSDWDWGDTTSDFVWPATRQPST